MVVQPGYDFRELYHSLKILTGIVLGIKGDFVPRLVVKGQRIMVLN